MGIYLNPGKEAFEEAINSEIFVDKTEMIQFLNSVVKTKQKYISISRPRRFGKTMAADMICAYYDREADSRQLFSQLKLSACAPFQNRNKILPWDAYLGQFDVIRIVMTDYIKYNTSVEQSLTRLQRILIRDFRNKYPNADYFDPDDLLQTMQDVYAYSGMQFVIIIDEWDAVFRMNKNDKEGQTQYLNFLRDWLKDKTYIALAYLTGILPIKKYGEHSALNMFREYSMIFPGHLARYTGFTEDEVQELCNRYGRDYEKIKDWYDGYEVSDIIPPDPGHKEQKSTGNALTAKRYALYSPLSVVEAMSTGIIKDYWNKTETYEALAEHIRRDYDGLKQAVAVLMDGGRIKVDTSTYENDMTSFHGKDDILTLLIHLGYLGFDNEQDEVFIPNREILDEFKTSTKSSDWIDTFKSFEISQKLLRATWEMNEDIVADLIEDAHDRTGNLTYNNEAALSYAIQYSYYAAQKYYTTILELDKGKGYADVIYLPAPRYPDKTALLIELKYDNKADTAMEQIKKQQYPQRLEHYKGNILLVAINYDKNIPSDQEGYKHHSCRIERA